MSIRKLFTLILAMILTLSSGVGALADKAIPDDSTVVISTRPISFANKTVILHSNDVHGALEGYACMAKLAKNLRDEGADVIIVDAGDYTQGSIYVNLNKGQAAIDLMNMVGYDVATLGNHEFDTGYDQLKLDLDSASFSVISGNITKDGEPILPATKLLERPTGMKIGFFGLETPETATKVNPNYLEGIHIAGGEEMYAIAQNSIDSLRAEGADLVFGLCHLGIDDETITTANRSVDMLAHVTGVNYIIDAHSHTIMTAGDHGEPVQSTGTKFAYIGLIVIDNETKAIEDHYLLDTRYLKKDPDVEAASQAIISEVDEQYGATFATSEVLLNGERSPGNRTDETNLGDLIADALIWSVLDEDGKIQGDPAGIVAITNGGGIRASVQAGNVSMKDINNVLPFGNTVAVVYVTGNELLETLEASTFCTPNAIGGFPQTSGMKWTVDTSIPYDQGDLYIKHDGSESTYFAPASIKRVTIESVNDKPFDPEATYAVVTNDFCAIGGDTYHAFMESWYSGSGFDTGIPMDEALMQYITQVLDGKITAEQYGEPHGNMTIK